MRQYADTEDECGIEYNTCEQGVLIIEEEARYEEVDDVLVAELIIEVAGGYECGIGQVEQVDEDIAEAADIGFAKFGKKDCVRLILW
jgi:hypothetical protein